MTERLKSSERDQFIPRHIALIMDGNRRWAKKRKLSPFKGHEVGRDMIEPIVIRCAELEIKSVSFYTLSIENLQRPSKELDPLLEILRIGAPLMIERLAREDVKFVPLGDLDLFPDDLQEILSQAARETCENKKLTFNLALAYGGRNEIVRAVKKLFNEDITGNMITEQAISDRLDTAGQFDPDLIIRTGGRSRLSGYLPWQSIYSELYFSDTLWPDFTVEEFNNILTWYGDQVRNFGK